MDKFCLGIKKMMKNHDFNSPSLNEQKVTSQGIPIAELAREVLLKLHLEKNSEPATTKIPLSLKNFLKIYAKPSVSCWIREAVLMRLRREAGGDEGGY